MNHHAHAPSPVPADIHGTPGSTPGQTGQGGPWPGRGAATFYAWANAALPRVFPGLPALTRAELALVWQLAARDIAARLAVACAREGLVAASLAEGLQLHTPGGVISLPIAHRGAFELHRPDLDAPRHPALEHPHALLIALAPVLGFTPATAARLEHELADSVFHLAIARACAELRVRARLTGAPWPAPLDPENLVVVGHPWHPMCKARLGLHLHEVLRSGPESLAAAEIAAVDVRTDLARCAGDFLDMSRALFPRAAPGWLRLPAHALQRVRLPRVLGALWGPDVRPAAVAPVPARALLSLRTVAAAGLHVKLSVDLHTTSARRQISPMSSHNGPRIGDLLGTIAVKDPQTNRGLRLQHEPGSAGLDPHALSERSELAGHLGVILRHDLRAPTESLAETVPGPGEAVAWVCAALGERWPGDPDELRADLPVPRDMAKSAGPITTGALLHRHEGDPLLRAITSAYPSPLLALQRYVELLVPPALRLCTAHGVALEMHLQNTLVVHRRGRLCGFIVRDLGGIRIHRGRLAAAGHAPDLAAHSFIVTDDLAETQTKLAHTLIHAHLGTVFAWAADLLHVDEGALWAHTRGVLDDTFAAWSRAEPRLTSACAEDRAALLAPVVQAKALLRMRIDERVSDYAYTRVPSPLAP